MVRYLSKPCRLYFRICRNLGTLKPNKDYDTQGDLRKAYIV